MPLRVSDTIHAPKTHSHTQPLELLEFKANFGGLDSIFLEM
jgi:hypothetical protein